MQHAGWPQSKCPTVIHEVPAVFSFKAHCTEATRNKCITSSNKCLTSSNKKLLNKCHTTRSIVRHTRSHGSFAHAPDSADESRAALGCVVSSSAVVVLPSAEKSLPFEASVLSVLLPEWMTMQSLITMFMNQCPIYCPGSPRATVTTVWATIAELAKLKRFLVPAFGGFRHQRANRPSSGLRRISELCGAKALVGRPWSPSNYLAVPLPTSTLHWYQEGEQSPSNPPVAARRSHCAMWRDVDDVIQLECKHAQKALVDSICVLESPQSAPKRLRIAGCHECESISRETTIIPLLKRRLKSADEPLFTSKNGTKRSWERFGTTKR